MLTRFKRICRPFEADLSEGKKITVREAKQKMKNWEEDFDELIKVNSWSGIKEKLFEKTNENSQIGKTIKSVFNCYEKQARKRKDMDLDRLKNVVGYALDSMKEKFTKDSKLITSLPKSKDNMVLPLTNRAIESLFSKEKHIERRKLKFKIS